MGAVGRRRRAAPQGGAQVAGAQSRERRLSGGTEPVLQTKGAGGRPAAALASGVVGSPSAFFTVSVSCYLSQVPALPW